MEFGELSFVAKLFDKEEVNTGRQGEIDFLKAFLIIGMIFVHVYEDCFLAHGILSDVICEYLCCIIGAASFMFCMGISMQYSSRVTPKNLALRGLSLLCVGQLLNLGRNVLPNMIAYGVTGGKWFLAEGMLVLQADILTFAALTFFVMALLLALKLSPGRILAVGAALSMISWICSYAVKSPASYLASQLLGFFIITKAESYFPFFSYFIFVAFGYFCGSYYRRLRDKDQACSFVIRVILPICVVYYLIRFFVPIPFLPEVSSDLQYSLQPLPDAVATSLVSILLLVLFYKIVKVWFHGTAPAAVSSISRNVNRYYCTSYMFILPLQTIFVAVYGGLPENSVAPFFVAVLVCVLCALVIRVYDRTLAGPIQKMKPPYKLGIYAVILLVTVLVLVYVYPKLDVYPNIWNDYLLDDLKGTGGVL